jgi:hypothetical protein
VLQRARARLRDLGRRLVAREGRWQRVVIGAACALVLGMYCTNVDMGGDPKSPRGDGKYRPVLARGDGHMLYLMARSTVLDRDWVFDNDLGRFGDPWNQPRTKSGRKGIPHPIGPALIWAPVLAVAHAGALAANAFGADIPEHGYDPWHQRIVFLTSVFFACGAVLLGRKVAARWIGGSWAPTYGAALVLLGTPLTYYATYMPSYAHAMDAFFCSLFLGGWALTIGRRDVKRFILLGLVLGMAMLIRQQDLAMGIVLAIEVIGALLASDGGPMKQRLRGALGLAWRSAITLAVALVVFTPQLLEWHIVYGSISELPQGAKYIRLGSPMFLELLFSGRNGWFSTTPIAYAAVIGLFCLPKRARLVAAGLGGAVLIQVYLNSSIMDWWGQAAFGQRRLCSVTLPLVVGLAALIWRLGRLAARAPRAPRWVWHLVLVIGLGSLAARNVARVGDYRGGKPAPIDMRPGCCDHLPPGVRQASRAVYNVIGNPFQLPASALFALRHGVELTRWDRAVGDYPIVSPQNSLFDGTLHKLRGQWKLGYDAGAPYLIAGFSPPMKGGKPLRWTTASSATAMVPNLMPYGQHYALWLAPGGATHVELDWDGDHVASADLKPGWQKVEFDVPDNPVGTHELTIRATPAMVTTPAPGFPAPPMPVGVAVNLLEITFLPGVDDL